MIKKRFGEDFLAKISGNVEVKVAEVIRKDPRTGKPRRPRGERGDRQDNRGDRGDRKPREPRENREGKEPR
jgi:hypothetical protein